MALHRSVAIAACVAVPLLLVGCDDNDAEQAVKEVTGAQEGTAVRDADVNQKTYTVEEINRIKDAETGELIGEEINQTDVTVQEQIKVEREVEVDSSDTASQTRGYVPEDLSDQ